MLEISMAKKVKEIARTGHLKQLDKLKKQLPSSLTEIMKLEQMGPRRTKILYEELNIESIDDLQKAAEQGEVEELEGFGKKTTQKILKEVEQFSKKGGSQRVKLHAAGEMIQPMLNYLEGEMKNIMKEAVSNGCFLEINSNPDRIDLKDKYIRQAWEAGLKLAITTDAHSIDNLDYIKYGVGQARRGWMGKDDIINTLNWKDLKKLLKRD